MIKNKPGNKIKIGIILLFQTTILLAISCVKGQDTTNTVTAVELVRMNVLNIDVDNPVKIAASGFESSELEVSIDNGTITGSNGEYIIRPEKIGTAIITVKCRGKEIQKSNFRVKSGINITVVLNIDSAVYVYDYKRLSIISKKYFLKATGIKVVAENSDFDLGIEIIAFTLEASVGDSSKQAISHNNNFTDAQKAIIREANPNSKIYIENIKAKAPDGSIRNLPPIFFTIKGE